MPSKQKQSIPSLHLIIRIARYNDEIDVYHIKIRFFSVYRDNKIDFYYKKMVYPNLFRQVKAKCNI